MMSAWAIQNELVLGQTKVAYKSNDAKTILKDKRSHGRIENPLHWVLDIAFREDESRVHKDHAAENLASFIIWF